MRLFLTLGLVFAAAICFTPPASFTQDAPQEK